MCGRYSFTGRPDSRWLGERFAAAPGSAEPPPPRWNIAPTAPVLVIGADQDGGRTSHVLRWDLHGKRPPTINLRSETALTRRWLAKLLGDPRSRVLIPSDGFYEWMHPEAPDQPKSPLRFFTPDEPVFAFAGVRSADGCALFTTTPNDLVRPVHDRMPVILDDRDQEQLWLSPGLDAPTAHALLDPLPAVAMEAAPVSSRLGDVRADGPELWEPDPPPAATRLF